jgi:hypothetical protein
MIIAKGLPTRLWAEAVSHAAYIRNRAPTRALEGKTPHEAWTGEKPDITHLQEFGCPVYILDEGDRSKLAPKSEKMIFVGFEDGPKAVRYYKPETQKVLVSRNYKFINLPETSEVTTEEVTNTDNFLEEESVSSEENHSKGSLEDNPIPNPTPHEPEVDYSPPNVRNVVQSIEERTKEARPQRANLKKVDYYELQHGKKRNSSKVSNTTQDNSNLAVGLERAFTAAEIGSNVDDPKTVEEARMMEDSEEWNEAMKAELDQLKEYGTWDQELMDLPKGRKAVGAKWVFVRKRDGGGNVVRHKARLIAQGFSQIAGQDYNQTYSPVARLESLRAIIAFAAIRKWQMHVIDVVGAYLNGELEKDLEIYIRQPPGFDDGTVRIRVQGHVRIESLFSHTLLIPSFKTE